MITIDESIPGQTVLQVQAVTNRQLLLTGAVGGVMGVVLSATAFNFAFPAVKKTGPYLTELKAKRESANKSK